MVEPDLRLRPADIFIPSWSIVGDMALDVTIIHYLPPSCFPATISLANDLLQRANTDKRELYKDMCAHHGFQFQPLDFTTWGLHGSGISFARELFLKVTLDRTRAAQLETEHELRASLSMRLMKEVAQRLETLSMIREAAWDDNLQSSESSKSSPPQKHPRRRRQTQRTHWEDCR
jgi:hypothetical protein